MPALCTAAHRPDGDRALHDVAARRPARRRPAEAGCPRPEPGPSVRGRLVAVARLAPERRAALPGSRWWELAARPHGRPPRVTAHRRLGPEDPADPRRPVPPRRRGHVPRSGVGLARRRRPHRRPARPDGGRARRCRRIHPPWPADGRGGPHRRRARARRTRRRRRPARRLARRGQRRRTRHHRRRDGRDRRSGHAGRHPAPTAGLACPAGTLRGPRRRSRGPGARRRPCPDAGRDRRAARARLRRQPGPQHSAVRVRPRLRCARLALPRDLRPGSGARWRHGRPPVGARCGLAAAGLGPGRRRSSARDRPGPRPHPRRLLRGSPRRHPRRGPAHAGQLADRCHAEPLPLRPGVGSTGARSRRSRGAPPRSCP